MSKLCKCTHWDVQHWQEGKLPTHCDMGGCECQSFEEYQSADLTTKLSRYEAMMAAAEVDSELWFEDSHVVLCADRLWRNNLWRENGEYKCPGYPSPLEAFEALQKERV